MSWAKYKRLSSSKDLSIFRRGTTASDGGGGGGGNDPDAQAYIDALDAAGYTVSAFQETAINDLVLGLKAENIYSINWSGYTPGAGVAIIDALYPYIGSASSPCGINLADPRDLDAAYRAAKWNKWLPPDVLNRCAIKRNHRALVWPWFGNGRKPRRVG